MPAASHQQSSLEGRQRVLPRAGLAFQQSQPDEVTRGRSHIGLDVQCELGLGLRPQSEPARWTRSR